MLSRGLALCAFIQALVLLGSCRGPQFASRTTDQSPTISPANAVISVDDEPIIEDTTETALPEDEETSAEDLAAEAEMNQMDEWDLLTQQIGHADGDVAAPGLVPPTGLELAVQDDAHFITIDSAKRSAALDEANNLGASYVRVNAIWIRKGSDPVDFPKDPCASGVSSRIHDMPCIYSLITEAQKRPTPVSVQLTLTALPVQKKDCRTGDKLDEREPAEYAHFVTEAIKTFCPLGVTRYSFFNEPDLGGIRTCLPKGTSSAAHYRKLYLAGYNAARRAAKSINATCNPSHLRLLIGELSSDQNRSMDWLYQVVKNHKMKASGLALHPYQFNSDPANKDSVYPYGIGSLSRTLNRLADFKTHGWLMTRGGAILPLYLTEFGYRRDKEMCCTSYCGSGPHCKPYKPYPPASEMCSGMCVGCPLDLHKKGVSMCLPEPLRGSYLTKSLDIALSEVGHGVRQLLYFHLYPDAPTHPGTWDSSIINNDPVDPYSPSYLALHGWACTHGYMVCP